MILLLGGTSETAPLATALAEAGHRVLVSTATNAPLDVGDHKDIHRRSGPLGVEGMLDLIRGPSIHAVVDATHPYAHEATRTAQDACRAAGVPYFSLVRPPTTMTGPHIHLAADHDEAARMAAAFGAPILLTTGTRNLEPYTVAARAQGRRLLVRVLPQPESLDACRNAGIAEAAIIAARGPFSVEANREALRRHGIGVMVTKDSGAAGGVPAKVEAARAEGCEVVVVTRPTDVPQNAYGSVAALVAAIPRLP
ncbi:precorrin-6A reductase [bacterium]|nr:precorrin-6A reductase [bacterium]